MLCFRLLLMSVSKLAFDLLGKLCFFIVFGLCCFLTPGHDRTVVLFLLCCINTFLLPKGVSIKVFSIFHTGSNAIYIIAHNISHSSRYFRPKRLLFWSLFAPTATGTTFAVVEIVLCFSALIFTDIVHDVVMFPRLAALLTIKIHCFPFQCDLFQHPYCRCLSYSVNFRKYILFFLPK